MDSPYDIARTTKGEEMSCNQYRQVTKIINSMRKSYGRNGSVRIQQQNTAQLTGALLRKKDA